MLDVFITIDTEIWCDGWDDLDEKFPEYFRRYVYGPTRNGDYALPVTLDILNDNGLTGVFFVESLFSARFGQGPLDELVGLIQMAKQEVQLHLHTEWVDEAYHPDLPKVSHKHQYIRMFDRGSQLRLIKFGKNCLHAAGVESIRAFRAGNFAINMDTFSALAENGIYIDTSYNGASKVGIADIAVGRSLLQAEQFCGVTEYPVTSFFDGRRQRHMQVTACSYREFEHLLWQALEQGWKSFVIVSHNFELLNPQKTRADPVAVNRFRKLCSFLAANRDSFRVCGFNELIDKPDMQTVTPLSSSAWRTGLRVAEQASRRLWAI